MHRIVGVPELQVGVIILDVLFILSSGDGYRGTSLTTLFPNENWSFVDLKGDGACQYVHTSFVHGEPGADGKTHNYWVYNVLGVEGSELRIANDIFPQFPKWIWYTFAPNHAETTQLTQEQKVRLWEGQGALTLTPVPATPTDRVQALD